MQLSPVGSRWKIANYTWHNLFVLIGSIYPPHSGIGCGQSQQENDAPDQNQHFNRAGNSAAQSAGRVSYRSWIRCVREFRYRLSSNPRSPWRAGRISNGRTGLSPLRIVATCAAAGLPTGLGALIGAYLGSVSEVFLSAALGFAAGAMLYLVFDELIPIAQELDEQNSATFGALTGLVLGIIFLELI